MPQRLPIYSGLFFLSFGLDLLKLIYLGLFILTHQYAFFAVIDHIKKLISIFFYI